MKSFKKQSISYESGQETLRSRLTLVGRKVEITSLTLAMAGTLIAVLERPMPPFGLGESKSIGVELMVKGLREKGKVVLVFSKVASKSHAFKSYESCISYKFSIESLCCRIVLFVVVG